MILRSLFLLCFLGWAAPAAGVTPTVLPPEALSPGLVEVQPIQLGPVSGCPTTFDNSQNYAGFYYGQQLGAESLDDLHAIAGGALCSFTVGYNEPGSNLVDLTVRIYSNNFGDSPPGGLVGGPWTITDLPPGANSVTLTLETSPVIPPNVWFGVQFSTTTAGVLISDPPPIGVSHDYFYEEPSGYLSFGGSPKANFYIRLQEELATPVVPSSWGSIKARYR